MLKSIEMIIHTNSLKMTKEKRENYMKNINDESSQQLAEDGVRNITNNTDNINGKEALKVIGFIFGGMFGVLFSFICVFSILDNIIYSTGYTHYDGIVIEADVVESYTSTTTRYKKTSSGRKQKITENTTRYRQDIVVEYNNTSSKMEDVSVDAHGYSVNDEISLYVSNSNPEDVKIHADISDKTYLYKFLTMVGGYWFIYLILLKKLIKRKKIENK